MTQEQKNYYEILGIPATAGPDEIRAVYRRLAFQFHPDRNSDPAAQEFFQQVIEAFGVLSDPESRRDYDAILFSDQTLITSAISSSLSAGDLYDSVAQKTGNQRSMSERDQYLRHLKKSRRRRTTLQTVISIIIVLLLIFYGFKPLRTSSQGVAPTTGTSSSGQSSTGSNSTTNGKPGSSLNQNLVVIQGPAGLQGIPGPAGRDGRIGIDGVPGPAGANGADGAQGPAGANGKDGAVGPAGPAGPTGAPGSNGAGGAAGAAGAAGAQGPAGANGANGAAGAAGAKGDQGERGPAGQDATVYTVKPNIGGAAGNIWPCNQNLSDTATAPGLDVTIDTRFESTSQKYMIAAINLKGFTASCRGVSVGINMVLASNASVHPNAVFQCIATLPANFTAPYTHSFVSGGTGCTKYSGSWGSSGDLDLGDVVASDLAKINLIVSG